MEYMRSLFGALCPDEDEVEARCMVAFSLWIGNHFIAADHGARSRADVLALALRRLEASQLRGPVSWAEENDSLATLPLQPFSSPPWGDRLMPRKDRAEEMST